MLIPVVKSLIRVLIVVGTSILPATGFSMGLCSKAFSVGSFSGGNVWEALRPLPKEYDVPLWEPLETVAAYFKRVSGPNDEIAELTDLLQREGIKVTFVRYAESTKESLQGRAVIVIKDEYIYDDDFRKERLIKIERRIHFGRVRDFSLGEYRASRTGYAQGYYFGLDTADFSRNEFRPITRWRPDLQLHVVPVPRIDERNDGFLVVEGL